ncbi:putative RNA binding protein MSSP-2 [Aspergillus candidus]|uniref:RRM domain-containing protein n=1 Tax=Aspergillus candidus TaxID=41067 RepID=A0A2I2EZW3_ASPCN|nr:hypothetical protein BDW47DRAFT_134705 [Aspergillus candidus]PLB33900.1 hypothetical protein BDW47DRAFT_134705 [Aspergillus candidus]
MTMHSQQHSGSEPSQGPTGQTSQCAPDTRGSYTSGYQQVLAGNNRDGNGTSLAPIFNSLNLQTQRSGSKYNNVKNNMPVAVPPALDLAGAQRTSYNSPLFFLPNGSMINGLPPVTPFTPGPVPGHDQVSQFPYMPGSIYPNMGPMVTATMPGYPFPYLMNCDPQDMGGQKRGPWISSEEQKGHGLSASDMSNQSEYYTGSTPSNIDGSTLSGFSYNGIPQIGPSCLPLQMMKTPTGYILQDLESLTQQDPPIPRAVPAMWTNPSELTLAKCLENREGITNVYIRGFLPETTDEMLHAYASRFGKIDRCKAIVDLDTGLCKGFGFVQYFNFESCENCIRGFFYLGYQASFAQKSRNSRLKDLEDKASTNIYCTNLPIDWTEADLRRHFEPFRVVSEKISRDEKTGVSKEVGFARFETRDIAENVLNEYHNVVGKDGVKLLLRFADTKAQKLLKQQSNERRAYRAGEYNYSVEVVQGSTPSPSLHRLQQTASHLSPNSQVSYPSPVGVGPPWTPATSISPSYPLVRNQAGDVRYNSWSAKNSPAGLASTPLQRGRLPLASRSTWMANSASGGSSMTAIPSTPCAESRSRASSPRKENMKSGSLSPISSRKQVAVHSPRSVM